MLGPKPSPGGVGAAAAMLHQITTGRASLPAAHSAAARPKSARAAKGTGGGGGGGGAGGWYPETIVEPGAGLRRYRDALFELGETVHVIVLIAHPPPQPFQAQHADALHRIGLDRAAPSRISVG